MKAQIGDCFLVQSGANKNGTGKQLAIVVKTTKKHAYCYKLSIRIKGFKIVANNYKLDESRIIKKVSLDYVDSLDPETGDLLSILASHFMCIEELGRQHENQIRDS